MISIAVISILRLRSPLLTFLLSIRPSFPSFHLFSPTSPTLLPALLALPAALHSPCSPYLPDYQPYALLTYPPFSSYSPARPTRPTRPACPTSFSRFTCLPPDYHRPSPYSPFVLPSFRPSPDRVPSCGDPGLGAPVIPPSRAGFPLRPRSLEGLGVSSPPGRSATTCGAGSCPGWRGSFSPLPGGRWGRVPL